MKTLTRRKTRIFFLLSSLIAVLFVAIISLSYFIYTRVSAGDKVKDEKIELKYDYDNRTSIPVAYLDFDYDDSTNTAIFKGIKSDSEVVSRRADGYFKYDTLEIPSIVQHTSSISGNSEPYTVIKIGNNGGTTELISVTNGSSMTHDSIMAIIIPKSVESIAPGAFRQFPRLEYFETPFVGTERGKTNDPASPLASMFSKKAPFMSTASNPTAIDGADSNTPDIDRYKTNQTVGTTTYTASEYMYTRDIKVNANDSQATNFSNVKMLDAIKKKSTISRWYSGDVTSDSNKNAYLLPQNLDHIKVTDDTGFIDRAFFELTNVTKIELPENLTNLDSLCLMAHCLSLTDVVFPIKCSIIGEMCLSQCESLVTVRMPSAISTIPKGMFSRCYGLVTVELPSSILTVETNAFQNCTALTNIKTYMFDNSTGAFIGYAAGSEVDGFNLPQAVQIIKNQAFVDCTGLTRVAISSSSLQEIEEGAFAGCTNITTITLPFIGRMKGNSNSEEAMFGWIFGKDDSDITQQWGSSVDDYQTYGLPSQLDTIVITNETYVSRGSMSNLKGVKTIAISQSATYIAEGAFEGCLDLEDITVPFVGSNQNGSRFAVIFGTKEAAVYGSTTVSGMIECQGYRVPPSLKTISITNMPTIRSGAFHNIRSLEQLVINNNTTYMEESIFYNNISLEEIELPFVGHQRGEKYERWWYYHSYQRYNSLGWLFNRTTSSDEYGVTILQAFGDRYTRWVPNTLKRIIINDETALGPHTFQGFKSVEEIRITNKPNYISSGAFKWCSGLKDITLPYIGSDINSNGSSGASYTFGWIFGSEYYEGSYAAGQGWATYYIPNNLERVTINGDIKIIPSYAFSNVKSLTAFRTDAAINGLNDHVFYNCINLSSITTPNASYRRVGDYAFYNCQKVTLLNDQHEVNGKLEGLYFIPLTATEIGNYAFAKTAIRNIDFDVNANYKIKSIGAYAFSDCNNITTLNIPEVGGSSLLQSLGTGAFARCNQLSSVTLGKNAASKYLFSGCTSLTSIDLRNVTKVVPEGILQGCSNLADLELDQQTTEIGQHAFEGCKSLTSFTIKPTMTKIGSFAFTDCSGLDYMFIPRNITVIEAEGFDGCDRNRFHFYVLDPQSDWPEGWVTNWNCDYPVYIYGNADDSDFVFNYIPSLHGYEISGVRNDDLFAGTLNIPSSHNGVDVVSVGANLLTGGVVDDPDNPGQTITTYAQSRVTSVILPSTIKRIQGERKVVGSNTVVEGPFAVSDMPFTVYINVSESTAKNPGYYYKYDELNARYTEELDTNNPLPSLFGNESNWIINGYVYYSDYWKLNTTTTGSLQVQLPYLRADKFVYEVDTNNTVIKYDGSEKTPGLAKVTTKAQVVTDSNDTLGLIKSLEIPTDLFDLRYEKNVEAGTAKIYVTANQQALSDYNSMIDLDNPPAFAQSGKNPRVACSDKLLITNTGTTTFTIDKKLIYIYPIDSDDNVVKRATYGDTNTTDYPWENSVWDVSNTEGLYGTGFTLIGTLTTKSKNAGTYYSANYDEAANGSLGDFRWNSSPVIKLGSQDVTRNFKIVLAPYGDYDDLFGATSKLVVIVDRLDVVVDWTGGFWADSNGASDGTFYNANSTYKRHGIESWANTTNGQEFYVWQYAGTKITPTANALKTNGTKITADILNLINTSEVFASNQTIKPNYKVGQATGNSTWNNSSDSATASLKDSVKSNYRLVAKNNLGEYEEVDAVAVKYFVTRKDVSINIDLPNYVIGYDDDYWYCDDFTDYITGLNPNSHIAGELQTIDNLSGQNADHRYSDNQIVWIQKGFSEYGGTGTPKDYHFYKITSTTVDEYGVETHTYEDETDCYNLTVTAYVKINYNDFDPYFTIDANIVEGYPSVDSQNQPILRIDYQTEGAVHVYRIGVNNVFEVGSVGPTIRYMHGVSMQDVSTTGITFTEIGEYPVNITISRKNFNTYSINTILDVIKSDIKFDSLTKEYDENPVDPLSKITKISIPTYDTRADQQRNSLTFTYYRASDTNYVSPLPGAPTEIGDYVVLAEAIESDYFNALHRYIPFSITKRKIVLNITGGVDYNGFEYSITYDFQSDNFLTNNLLPNHRFTGVLNTISKNPGVYYGTGQNDAGQDVKYTSSWYWSFNWAVRNDVTLESDLAKYYEVSVIGRFEIRELVITNANVISYGDPQNPSDSLYFDGLPHKIHVEVTGLRADANPVIYYSLEERNAGTEANDKNYTGTPWSRVNPEFYTPKSNGENGVYDVWFKIVANNYEPYYGHEVVVIKANTIEYKVGYTLGDQPIYNPLSNMTDVTVEFDGTSHQFVVGIDNPGYALVEYSLDKSSWRTQPYEYKEVIERVIYYRITADNYAPVEGEVTFKISEDSFLDITPADYTVTGFSGPFDNLPHKITVTITNPNIVSYELYYRLSDSEEWSQINPSFTDITPGTNGQRVYFRIFNARDSQGNKFKDYYSYSDQYVYGVVNITSLEFNVTVTGGTFDYDGEYHGLTINGIDNYASAGYTIYYSSDPYSQETGQGWSTTELKYKNVSTTPYKIYIKITAPNYKDKYLDDYILIKQVDITPEFGDGNTEFDPFEIQYLARAVKDTELPIDTIHDGARTYSYYLATETAWYDPVTGNPTTKCIPDLTNKISNPTSLGLYYVTVKFNATPNCKEVTISGFFRIVKRVIEVKYDEERQYTGDALSPGFESKSGTTDTIALKVSLVDPVGITFDDVVDIGEYKYYVEIADAKMKALYELPQEFNTPVTFKIVQRQIKLNVKDKFVYDGQTKWTATEASTQLANWISGEILTNKGHTLHLSMETASYVRMTYYYPMDTITSPQNAVYINQCYITDSNNVIVADFTNPQPTDLYVIEINAEVAIVYQEVAYSFSDKEVYYDGDSHYLSLSVNSAEIHDPVVSYAELPSGVDPTDPDFKYEDLTWSLYSPSYVNVGEYVVYVRIESSNCETIYTTAKLIIKKAILTVQFTDFDVTYDANSHTTSVKVTNLIDRVARTTLPTSIKYYPKSTYSMEDIVNIYEDMKGIGQLVYTRALTNVTDAGDYYAVAMYTGTSNYEYGYYIKEITLKQRDIRVALSTTPRNRTKDYDGERSYDYLAGATFDSNDLVYGQRLVDSNKFGAYRIQTKSANAGTYRENDFEFEIKNGSGGIIFDGNKDVTKNYHPVIITDITHVINKVRLVFSVATNTTQEFDTYFTGTEYKPKLAAPTITLPNKANPKLYVDDIVLHYTYYTVLPPDQQGTYLGKDDQYNVGLYYVLVTTEESTNYLAYTDLDKHGIVEVTPKTVEVIWENLEQQFSAQNLAPSATYVDAYGITRNLDIEITVSEMVGGTYVATIEQFAIKAGRYSVLAVFADSTTNYVLSGASENATFVITPLKFEYNVNDTTYNTQAAWTKYLDETNFIGFPSALQLTGPDGTGKAELTTDSTAAGTYLGRNLVWKYMVKDNMGKDYTQSIILEAKGKVVIINEGIVFETKNLEYDYDSHRHYLTDGLTVTHPSREQDYELLVRYKDDPSNTEYRTLTEEFGVIDVGVYDFEFRIVSKVSTTQSERFGEIRITIKQIPADATITSDLDKIYDGVAVSNSSIVVDGVYNQVAGAQLVYKYYLCDNQFNVINPVPLDYEPVDVGYYRVVVTTTADDTTLFPDNVNGYIRNYGPLNVYKNFEITKRKVVVTIDEDYIVALDSITDQAYLNLTKDKNGNTHLITDAWTYNSGVVIGNLNLASTEQMQFVITTNNMGASLPLGVQTFEGEIPELTSIGTSVYTFGNNNLFSISWDIKSTSRKDSSNQNLDVTTNYDFVLNLKVDVHHPDIKVNISAPTVSYIPAQQVYASRTFDASVVGNVVEEYKYEPLSRLTNDITSMFFTDPGNYDVNYSYQATGYRSTTGKYTIRISYSDRKLLKTNNEYVYLNQSKSYDGQYVTMPLYAFDYNGLPAGQAQDNYDVTKVTVTFQKTTESFKRTKIVDAGTYTYKIKVPASSYYNATEITGTYTITRAEIRIDNKPNTDYEIGYTARQARYEIYVSSATPDTFYTVKVKDSSNNYVDLPVGLTFACTLLTSDSEVNTYYANVGNKTVGFASGYSITDASGNDVSINYQASLGDVTIKIKEGNIQASLANQVQTYKEENNVAKKYSLEPSITVPSEWDSLEYSTDGVTYQSEVLEYSLPGTYNIYIKIHAENYVSYVVSGTLVINRATPTLTIPQLDKTYDNLDPLTPEEILSNTDIPRGDGSGADGGWKITYQRWDPAANSGLGDWVGMGQNRPVDVGRYQVTVDIPDTSTKYTGIQKSKEFVISPCELKVQWDNLGYTYNGKPQQPTAVFAVSQENLSNNQLTSIIASLSVDYTIVNARTGLADGNIQAGIYNIKVVIDNNDNFTIDIASQTSIYTINKRAVIIQNVDTNGIYVDSEKRQYAFYYQNVPAGLTPTDAAFSKTFDAYRHPSYGESGLVVDDPLTPDDETDEFWEYSAISTNNYIAEYYKSTYNKDSKRLEGIGDYEWTTNCIIYNSQGQDVTDSYEIYYRFDFQIDYSDIEVEYRPYIGEYDATNHTFELVVKNSSAYTIEYEVGGVWTTVKPEYKDVYKVGGVVSARSIDYRITSPSFNTKTGTGQITITPKTANLQLVRPYVLDKEYDGLPVANPQVDYIDKNIYPRPVTYSYKRTVGGVDLITDSASEVGQYVLTVSLDEGNDDNYIGGTISVSFEISKRTLIIRHVDSHGLILPITKVYDMLRLEHDVTNTDVVGLSDYTKETFTGTVQTKYVNVRKYETQTDFLWKSGYSIKRVVNQGGVNTELDVTSNYTIEFDLNFEITPATIQYTARNVEGEVNGQEYFINVQVSEPANYVINYYTLLDKSDISTTNPKYMMRGEYTVYFEITAPNYTTIHDERSIKIKGNTAGGFINYLPTQEYNGKPYMTDTANGKPIFQFLGPFMDNDGQQRVVYYKDGAPYTNGVPTEAGEYSLVILVDTDSAGKYEPITSNEVTFTITRVNVDAIWGINGVDVTNISQDGVYLETTYNGNVQTPYAYFTDVNGQRVNLDVQGAQTEANPEVDDPLVGPAYYDVSAGITESIMKNYNVGNRTQNAKFKIYPQRVSKPSIEPNMSFVYSELYRKYDIENGEYEKDGNGDDICYRFGDEIKIYTKNPGEYYVFDETSLTPNVPIATTTDGVTLTNLTDILYSMKLDEDANADAYIGKNHYVTVELNDKRNYMWDVVSDYDQDDYQVQYVINKFDINNQVGTDFIIKAFAVDPTDTTKKQDYVILDIGESTEPMVRVQMLTSDGKTLVKEFIVTPKGQVKAYVDGQWVPTEVWYEHRDNKVNTSADYGVDGKIDVDCVGNFIFSDTATYEKRATPPVTFELNKNSVRRFIEITIDSTKNNRVAKNDGSDYGVERTTVKEENKYLGRIYPKTTIQEVVNDFVNDKDCIAVYDHTGALIDPANYGNRFATGYVIRLYKDKASRDAEDAANLVDEITGIIFGDINSDGLVNVNDLAYLQAYVTAKRSINDGIPAYLAATLGNNIGPNVNSLAVIQAFISKNTDFNANYKDTPEVVHAGS